MNLRVQGQPGLQREFQEYTEESCLLKKKGEREGRRGGKESHSVWHLTKNDQAGKEMQPELGGEGIP